MVTASAAGLLTMLGSPSYSVSKHAAVAFAEWLSATYRHRGVVVQAICPQGVRTRMYEEAGPLQDDAQPRRALTPEDVAQSVWEALQDDRFLVLPHPEVGGYYTARATDTDRWLAGMNRLQQRLDAANDGRRGDMVPSVRSPLQISAAQLHAGRTVEPGELHPRYEPGSPAHPARSWIHRYPQRTPDGGH